ncbi:hypothetical protein AeMF1_002067 [Aphanomyces euteiches]|nr:hypothetical protein AeMF1_002067 [Aphanomyces euteiches]KAH9194866.1 hypothetical protein AeNC1_003169 [Aphanomyces euteiches]
MAPNRLEKQPLLSPQDSPTLMLSPASKTFVLRSSILLFLALIDLLVGCGVSQAMKNYMQDRLGYSFVATSSIRSTAACLGNLAPLLGAYIGDECWGPFRKAQVFGIVCVVTKLLLSFSAHPTILTDYLPLSNAIFLAILFVGNPLGNGCFTSNLVILGADQLADATPKQKQLYFSNFYLLRNVGCIFAFTYLAYLSVNGMEPYIPATFGYFATFSVCSVLLAIAVGLFIYHSDSFVKRQPQDKAFTGFFATIYTSTQVCPELKSIIGGFALFLASFFLNVAAILTDPKTETSHFLSYAAGALVVLGMFLWIFNGMDPSYLDRHPTMSLSDAADLKSVLRLLPFASFLVVWLVMFDQFDSNYQSMTQQTDLRLGSGRDAPQVPGSMLCLFDPLGLVILLPLLDHVIFPWIESKRGKPPSPYEKVLAGLSFGVVNMLWTAQVEVWRRDSGPIDLGDGLGPLLDLGSHQPMNNLPWTYMIPTYLLHSLCESLIQVTALDVFYNYVPGHLKCTAQATRSFMGAMGENVASIFVLGFAKFIPDNINHGHMEYLYYALGAAALVNAAGFAFVMQRMQFGMHDKVDPFQHSVNAAVS